MFRFQLLLLLLLCSNSVLKNVGCNVRQLKTGVKKFRQSVVKSEKEVVEYCTRWCRAWSHCYTATCDNCCCNGSSTNTSC